MSANDYPCSSAINIDRNGIRLGQYIKFDFSEDFLLYDRGRTVVVALNPNGPVAGQIVAVAAAETAQALVDANAYTDAAEANAIAVAAADATAKADAAEAAADATASAAILLATTRLTALDNSHLHAWELDDAAGDFQDTGSSSSKVALTATTAANLVLYGTKGIVGDCPEFAVLPSTGASNNSGANRVMTAFSDFPLQNLSLECWFKPYVSALNTIVGIDQAGVHIFNFNIVDATTGLMTATITVAGSPLSLSTTIKNMGVPGIWHHAMLTYDGANGRFYLDGELARTGAKTGNIDANAVGTRMNVATTQNGGNTFKGQISRVRVSNIVRDQAYIRAVYKKGMLY